METILTLVTLGEYDDFRIAGHFMLPVDYCIEEEFAKFIPPEGTAWYEISGEFMTSIRSKYKEVFVSKAWFDGDSR